MLTSKRSLNLIICRFVSLFLCLSLATGCTTLNPLVPAEPQAIMAQVKPGDEVRLTTRDGRVRELTVQEATGQQLVGEQERVTLSDITMTVGLVCGIIGVVVLAFAISFLASFRP